MEIVQRIIRLMKSDKEEASQHCLNAESSYVPLFATLTQGATVMEKFLRSDSGRSRTNDTVIIDELRQQTTI